MEQQNNTHTSNNSNNVQPPKKRTWRFWVTLILCLLITLGSLFVGAYIIHLQDQSDVAKKAWSVSVNKAEKCNKSLQSTIDEGKRLYDSKPETDSVLPIQYLKQTLDRASSELVELPVKPDKYKDVIAMPEEIGCADEDSVYANAIWQAYNQVLQSVQTKSQNDVAKDQGKAVQDAVKQPEYKAPNYVPPKEECKQEKWVDANGIEFTGCANPLEGDKDEYEWKDWEQALKDGDLCIVTDAVTGKKMAKMQEECPKK